MSNRKQPFGYRMSNGEIIVDVCEAEIIKEVYCRYVSGSSFKELADIMNGRKIKILRRENVESQYDWENPRGRTIYRYKRTPGDNQRGRLYGSG